MTAPDYHPFLLPTDLRTPEDVLPCVLNFAVDPDIERDATDVFNYLSARLDRERRQACRRGALELTRAIARQKLWLRSDYAQNKGSERFGTFAACMAHQREMRWGSDLRRALAFRAAARAT